MIRRTLGVGLCVLVGACGANPKPQIPTPPPAKPVVDPVDNLIATSQRHFQIGEKELTSGHPDKAREEFDRSVAVLLDAPYGARTDTRLREHFDRLIDRINAYEVSALAQGDGFTEKKYEAAPIDELLKNATTFPAPAADAATQAVVKADLERHAHDIPIPDHPKLSLIHI